MPHLCDAYKCNEDKCCVLTNRLEDILLASLGLFTWLVYVRTYCVPITTLNQNKRFRLLYRPNNNNYCKRDIRGGWHKFLLEKVLITCSVVAIKTYQTWPAAKTIYTHGLFRKIAVLKTMIIQLLDEVEHDIMNYQKRGLCYLPKPKAEADNTDTRFW